MSISSNPLQTLLHVHNYKILPQHPLYNYSFSYVNSLLLYLNSRKVDLSLSLASPSLSPVMLCFGIVLMVIMRHEKLMNKEIFGCVQYDQSV